MLRYSDTKPSCLMNLIQLETNFTRGMSESHLPLFIPFSKKKNLQKSSHTSKSIQLLKFISLYRIFFFPITNLQQKKLLWKGTKSTYNHLCWIQLSINLYNYDQIIFPLICELSSDENNCWIMLRLVSSEEQCSLIGVPGRRHQKV